MSCVQHFFLSLAMSLHRIIENRRTCMRRRPPSITLLARRNILRQMKNGSPPTVGLKLKKVKACLVIRKPNTGQYSMDPRDSKNVYGRSRLQHPNFIPKIQGWPKFLQCKFGCCNLGLPYTFLESP